MCIDYRHAVLNTKEISSENFNFLKEYFAFHVWEWEQCFLYRVWSLWLEDSRAIHGSPNPVWIYCSCIVQNVMQKWYTYFLFHFFTFSVLLY